jgi:hypothetical protein
MKHVGFKFDECEVAGSEHTDNAHHNPKDIQQGIGIIFFKDGTPGKNHSVRGVKSPDKKEWAFRAHPTDQRETENPHQHTDHFDEANVFNNK